MTTKRRFFRQPSGYLLSTAIGSIAVPSGVIEITEAEYFANIASRLEIWNWRGKWHVVLPPHQEPLRSCDSCENALQFAHGYCGQLPKSENIHG